MNQNTPCGGGSESGLSSYLLISCLPHDPKASCKIYRRVDTGLYGLPVLNQFSGSHQITIRWNKHKTASKQAGPMIRMLHC